MQIGRAKIQILAGSARLESISRALVNASLSFWQPIRCAISIICRLHKVRALVPVAEASREFHFYLSRPVGNPFSRRPSHDFSQPGPYENLIPGSLGPAGLHVELL